MDCEGLSLLCWMRDDSIDLVYFRQQGWCNEIANVYGKSKRGETV